MSNTGRRKRRHPGRVKQRHQGRAQTVADAQAIYLDHLHREDSGQARNWNNAPPPGRRRQGRPAIPQTAQRGGGRYERAGASDIERAYTGAPGVKLFYVTTTSGKIVMVKIEQD